VHGEIFHLVNVYAPVGGVNSALADQEVFFGSLHRFAFSSFPVIFGGDFNCVDNPVIDRTFYDTKL